MTSSRCCKWPSCVLSSLGVGASLRSRPMYVCRKASVDCDVSISSEAKHCSSSGKTCESISVACATNGGWASSLSQQSRSSMASAATCRQREARAQGRSERARAGESERARERERAARGARVGTCVTVTTGVWMAIAGVARTSAASLVVMVMPCCTPSASVGTIRTLCRCSSFGAASMRFSTTSISTAHAPSCSGGLSKKGVSNPSQLAFATKPIGIHGT